MQRVVGIIGNHAGVMLGGAPPRGSCKYEVDFAIVIVHEVYFAVVDFVVMSKGHPFVKRRKALHLTQADVAKSIGLSTRAIQLWEAGTHEPRLTLRQVVSLCKLLECKAEDLAADFEAMHEAT